MSLFFELNYLFSLRLIDEETYDDETDEGTLKNIDLLSAFNDSTSDDVSSLVTDITEDNTLVDEQSSAIAIEDSLIAAEEMQSAVMLYNDGFPPGQETIIENSKFQIRFFKQHRQKYTFQTQIQNFI